MGDDQTTLFNVWSPATVGAQEVAFDVTQANLPRAASGDPEWIAACLAAVGVTAAARTWSLRAARCHFYSDYTSADEEWGDRWPETWMTRVQLDGAAPRDFGGPDPLPRGVDRYDRTWQHDQEDPAHDQNALLLFLFRGRGDDVSRRAEALVAALPAGLSVSERRVEAAGAEWTRVRFVVSGPVFPAQVEALEEIVEKARKDGFIVNRNDLTAL